MRLSPRLSAGLSRWLNHRSRRARLVTTMVAAVMLASLFTVTAVMKSRGWKPKGSSAQTLASKVDVAPNRRSPQEQGRPNRPLPDVVQVVGPVRQDHRLRDLPYVPPKPEFEETILTRYPRGTGQTGAPAGYGSSGLPQIQAPLENLLGPAPTMPSPLLTFAGINVSQSSCACAPPDSIGDVGPNHYVEAVNVAFKV
ncbi:MAG TPA: hypothetical protein VLR92_00980, partial [Blastocatellia bacterium]|nr:hypothetical protein [Blastocatellia bacterium]